MFRRLPWAMWTYKRIDDPLEFELWGTQTAWGLWQHLDTAGWTRADVWYDDKTTLQSSLSRYTTDRMTLNQQLYNTLSSRLKTPAKMRH